MNPRISPKGSNPWIIPLCVVGVALTGGTGWYTLSRLQPTPEPALASIPVPTRVTALGRLEPQTEVISLNAPATLQDDRIAELTVKQGDRVNKGQIIAILESRDRLQASLEQAQEQVSVAQSKLEQVKAGAKTGEIAAQEATLRRIEAQWRAERTAQAATINKLEAQLQGDLLVQTATLSKLSAELNNAQSEYKRHQQLHAEGAISNSVLDTKRLAVETAQAQLNEGKAALNRFQQTGREQIEEAKATLNRINNTASEELDEARATLNKISEVRPVDVQAATAEVRSALAAVRKAEAELALAVVRSPIDGTILKVHTIGGEKISDHGIVDLGQIDSMRVIAEIYQTDISKVKIGQKATIQASALPGELAGEVVETGFQVSRQNVFSNEPGENLDRRVVEVTIQLTPAASQKVNQLTNLQVEVAIETTSK